ncbi:MAG TPA: hypothetical protein DDZ83_07095 [Nitrospinae bacterium]|nr:hypothetical protein [Nitrospinota bacterium]
MFYINFWIGFFQPPPFLYQQTLQIEGFRLGNLRNGFGAESIGNRHFAAKHLHFNGIFWNFLD